MSEDEYDEAVRQRTMELTLRGVIDLLEEALKSNNPRAVEQTLLEICLTKDELKERLEDWKLDAEKEIAEENPKPCCKDFHCPCGG